MRLLKENLLARFSVASLAIMLGLAVLISTMVSSRLEHNLEHLREYGAAMMAGNMIKPADHISIPSIAADVRNLRLVDAWHGRCGLFLLIPKPCLDRCKGLEDHKATPGGTSQI